MEIAQQFFVWPLLGVIWNKKPEQKTLKKENFGEHPNKIDQMKENLRCHLNAAADIDSKFFNLLDQFFCHASLNFMAHFSLVS